MTPEEATTLHRQVLGRSAVHGFRPGQVIEPEDVAQTAVLLCLERPQTYSPRAPRRRTVDALRVVWGWRLRHPGMVVSVEPGVIEQWASHRDTPEAWAIAHETLGEALRWVSFAPWKRSEERRSGHGLPWRLLKGHMPQWMTHE